MAKQGKNKINFNKQTCLLIRYMRVFIFKNLLSNIGYMTALVYTALVNEGV